MGWGAWRLGESRSFRAADARSRLHLPRYRGGLVFKAHRWLYHSTLGSRVITMKKKKVPQSGLFGFHYEYWRTHILKQIAVCRDVCTSLNKHTFAASLKSGPDIKLLLFYSDTNSPAKRLFL